MGGIRIYIIDDSEFNNFYLQDMLSDIEYVSEVSVFTNPLEAFNSLKSKLGGGELLPSLLLLDINMPHMTGFELIDELVGLGDNRIDEMKIFIISSSDHKYDLEAFANQPRAQEYLLKPIEEKTLREMIQIHLLD